MRCTRREEVRLSRSHTLAFWESKSNCIHRDAGGRWERRLTCLVSYCGVTMSCMGPSAQGFEPEGGAVVMMKGDRDSTKLAMMLEMVRMRKPSMVVLPAPGDGVRKGWAAGQWTGSTIGTGWDECMRHQQLGSRSKGGPNDRRGDKA